MPKAIVEANFKKYNKQKMKTISKLYLVTLIFLTCLGISYSQGKPKDDPKHPDIAIQNAKVKYDLLTTKGNSSNYEVVITYDVVNFGENPTPAVKINMKCSLGVLGPNDNHNFMANGKTFTKVQNIPSLSYGNKKNIVWKFQYTAVGELVCYDFNAMVANKILHEFIIDNNKLSMKIDCAHPH